MAAAYHHALAVGTYIESYEIQSVLGMGSFGITYLARDHDLQRPVAIKEYFPVTLAVRLINGVAIAPRSENDRKYYAYCLARFLEEARTLAKFQQPNIVRVVRYLEANDTAYLVMDYEEGESLEARLQWVGTLQEAEIRAIVLPLLRSLAVIHAASVLHHDIKPDNVLIRRDGTPVLLDFGSARQAMSEQGRTMTKILTPGYAPFEQYLSRNKQSPSTDLYAIGATMYRCATGLAPVPAPERIAALHDGDPDPMYLAVLHGRFSTPFVEAMAWMLQSKATDRPQSTEQVIRMLEAEAPIIINSNRPLAPIEDAPTAIAAPIPPPAKIDHPPAPVVSAAVPAPIISAAAPAAKPTSPVAPSFSPALTASTASTLPTAAMVNQAEARLTDYIGPIARLLVKKALAQAKSSHDFLRILAEEFSNEEQKKNFLRALHRA